MFKKRRNNKKTNRKRPMRKQRIPRSLETQKQYASIVETIELADLVPNSVYPQYFSLKDFPRAKFVGVNFRKMRPVKVTYTYSPLYNTFQESVGTAVSAPYVYYRMNRAQDARLPNSFSDLKRMGAMPEKFTKSKHITYRPNWNSPGLTAITVVGPSNPAIGGMVTLGQKSEFGWIDTSPFLSTQDPRGATIVPVGGFARNAPGHLNPIIDQDLLTNSYRPNTNWSQYCIYNGHVIYFEQEFTGGTETPQICKVTITVHWEFKEPIADSDIFYSNYVSSPPPTRGLVLSDGSANSNNTTNTTTNIIDNNIVQ